MSQKSGRTRDAGRRKRSKAKRPASSAGWTTAQKCVVLGVGLAFSLGVALHWGYLNGVEEVTNWVWAWRDLGLMRTGALLAGPFALVAGVLWTAENSGTPANLPLLLGTLALANILLQALGMVADPRGIDLVRQIVASRGATSYFFDATRIHEPLRQWLAHFQTAALERHSETHPAGPILFYDAFLTVLGPFSGALIGGFAVGLLGSAGVVVMYAFAGLWTPDPRTRLTASAWYALLPALTVFFPEFDQAYPVFSMLLILFWVRALEARPAALRYAMASGLVLFTATFSAYNLLVIGAFLAYYAGYWLWTQKWARGSWTTLLLTSAVALTTCVGLYAVLWLVGGYDPIASFRHAMANQVILAQETVRPYAPFAMLDPLDFLLGGGVIAAPILFWHLRRVRAAWTAQQVPTALTLIGLATILTIDLSGVLRGETARVWLFLQPLVVVPVALELSTLSRPWKLSLFALQWWILVCLKAEMIFVNP